MTISGRKDYISLRFSSFSEKNNNNHACTEICQIDVYPYPQSMIVNLIVK